jgi:hypothetical protein
MPNYQPTNLHWYVVGTSTYGQGSARGGFSARGGARPGGGVTLIIHTIIRSIQIKKKHGATTVSGGAGRR